MELTTNYFLRLALLNDSDIIRSFISDYWKKDHIYVLDKKLFDFDFMDGDNINFILAFDEKKVLTGILGFIKYNSGNAEQIFTVMWKVVANISDPMLGIKLLKYLIQLHPDSHFSTVGANKKTLPIYKYLGFTTGKLEHFFIINNTLKNYKVLRFINTLQLINPTQHIEDDKFSLQLLSHDQIKNYFLVSNSITNNIINEFDSFSKRFLKHPYYSYLIYGITDEFKLQNILVIRELDVNKVKIGRIVNFIGDPQNLIYIKGAMCNLVVKNNYEYLDFYEFGINDQILLNTGFIKKNINQIIVPNYFEPFVSENIDINFFTSNSNPFLYKGHGDQDRPNVLQS